MSGTKHIPVAASARALSPVRPPLSSNNNSASKTKMPSPRSSPAIRPQSPLSPRFDTASRFEPLRPPSPRSMSTRPGNTQRRVNSHGLKLPSLPRFHPSNYSSPQSSAQTTPDAGPTSPQIPAPPRLHQRVVSDAQKHLLAYQRETVSAAARSSAPTHLDDPESPRLMPLGSPGPVTPLELESEGDDYLMSGGGPTRDQAVESQELVERLLHQQGPRQWNAPPRHAGR
ncbi:hypothetical protein BDY17DRAFT_120491 [Neohortaea acidophila]|uniref:Uncharacterized protein n=1 Tax=Neohortaea acidophila TaxID=245834 RepID=A0A6A6PWA9_9PEZI|nr:uncharacterized protein BDY17DRAFT_120491 [Neohortaea acidophila]KAF2484056.1 hypothetical protein BDY17DRAFT_120491 [Neohortaea acidophila]